LLIGTWAMLVMKRFVSQNSLSLDKLTHPHGNNDS
jgi:hypothetical protein